MRFVRGLGAVIALAALVGGIPVLLIRAAGWPLPSEVPTWDGVLETLTSEISDRTLINVLVCFGWLVWSAFIVALVTAASASMRGVRVRLLPGLGTLQRLAAALITALGISVLVPVLRTDFMSHPAAAAVVQTVHAPTAKAEPEIHTVKRGESLWRIAEQELGSGRRWRELWRVNGHHRQIDGTRFTNPNLIRPGWRIEIPQARPEPPVRHPQVEPPREKEPKKETSPPPPVVCAIPPTAAAPPASVTPPPEVEVPDRGSSSSDVELPTGAWVALSLVVALGAAIVRARRRQRLRAAQRRVVRRPVPADVKVAGPPAVETPAQPEVRLSPALGRLRQAHLTWANEHGADPDCLGNAFDVHVKPPPDESDRQKAATGEPREVLLPPGRLLMGRAADGSELRVDLCTLGGLGLTGPGATGALRAAVLAILTANRFLQAEVVLPATLAGQLQVAEAPGLVVRPSANDVLSYAEAAVIHRQRMLDEAELSDVLALRAQYPEDPMPSLVVVLSAAEADHGRLQGTLAAGGKYDVSGLFDGAWPHGVTVEVSADGHVRSGDGPLAGARLQVITKRETAAVLEVVSDAQGDDLSELAPAQVVAEAGPPIKIRLLGPYRIEALGQEIATGLRRESRELLALLAVHRDGMRQDSIVEALWPYGDARRDLRADVQRFHTAKSNLRAVFRKTTGLVSEEFLVRSGDRYHLANDLFSVDLWTFTDALDRDSLREVVGLLGGKALDGVDGLWAEGPRTLLHQRVIDALARLARSVDSADESVTYLDRLLDLAEDEEHFQVVMRVQSDLKRQDLVTRTYRLLENRMRDIDCEPSEKSRELLSQKGRR